MLDKYIILILTQICSNILQLLSTYFLAVNLNVNVMGIFAFVMSASSLFSSFTDLGLSWVHFQRSSDVHFKNNFSTFFYLRLILIFSNTIFFAFFLLFIPSIENEVKGLIWITSIAVLIQGISSIFIIDLEAKRKIYKRSICQLIPISLLSIIKIYIAFNIDNYTNPILLIVITTALIQIFQLFLFLVISKNDVRFTKWDKGLAKSYLHDIRFLGFVSFFYYLCPNIGYILLRFTEGYESLAYFYVINNSIIFILNQISISPSNLNITIFSNYVSKQEFYKIQDFSRNQEKYFAIFFSMFIIITFLNGNLILKIILPNYVNSILILKILIWVPFLQATTRPYMDLLVSGKKQDLLSKYLITTLILKTILTFVIVPHQIFSLSTLGLGTTGLAVLEISFWVLDSFIYRYLCRHFWDIKYSKKIFLILLLSVISFFIGYMIEVLVLSNLVIPLPIYFIISLISLFGIFFCLLFIFNLINKKEILTLLNIFSIRRYVKSFKEEFTN